MHFNFISICDLKIDSSKPVSKFKMVLYKLFKGMINPLVLDLISLHKWVSCNSRSVHSGAAFLSCISNSLIDEIGINIELEFSNSLLFDLRKIMFLKYSLKIVTANSSQLKKISLPNHCF